MPDRYPLLPGHVLIITREHQRCHAQRPAETDAELVAAAERVRRFLADAYGMPALAWENGVCGQTVFHAHLHLLPIPATALPPELDEIDGVVPIGDWRPVREHFAARGGYHYLGLGQERRLIPGGSAAIAVVRRWLAAHTGLQSNHAGWLKTTTEADVRELAARWQAWVGRSGNEPGAAGLR
jgi:diadenosine tetraphosphate (Ap4A) HIT family hydrolase